ncbi:ADP-heptose--LPS heptosyltransferase RfaF [Seonamhaeicola sp. S2-3]|uniref:glycosyltransferase family 9 protein n=1 Tax=Seonamhaeicola sp. S2-3 TaxID=1936081 RepID=UPI000972832C|nr:glycosyltransferase family 9 protein [Seonamhaeicola sp. S2-3]APY11015.1 ADP-heptose--LPS heptosyltransferase RfaF [Seonamhaeicola sp. S2-3]
MTKPKHILVIRLSAMGDVAMTAPVLRALITKYPELKITVLTRDFFAPFFRDLPNVKVFPAAVKTKHKGVFGLYKLSKELKALEIDAVADLHNVLRSNILKIFLKGFPFVQIDKGREEKKKLVSGTFFKALKTTHQRYADVFKKLGFEVDLLNPNFPKKVPLSNKLQLLLGDSFKKKIGIAPFAAHESKMYPLHLMEEVISELSKEHLVVLFGGGKTETEILSGIENTFDNVVNIAGKLTLNEELDVISNLDVMLSMDSGNAHIAAMLGIKTVTVWGVTHPYAGFAPFNQPEDFCLLADRTQYPKIPTSVYGNKFPEDYKDAAGSIAPKTIINKIISVI